MSNETEITKEQLDVQYKEIRKQQTFICDALDKARETVELLEKQLKKSLEDQQENMQKQIELNSK